MNIARDIHSVQLMTNDYINWLLYWSLEIVSGTKQTLHFLFQSCAITVVISSWHVLNIFVNVLLFHYHTKKSSLATFHPAMYAQQNDVIDLCFKSLGDCIWWTLGRGNHHLHMQLSSFFEKKYSFLRTQRKKLKFLF